MAYTTINKSSSFQNTTLYTGNGSTQAITGVGFQPDLTWIKSRGYAEDHQLTDAVRGVTKSIQSNLINAESTFSDGLTAFGADGFSVGSKSDFNYNTDTLVSWNWKAGTTSGLSGGTITPSAYSINTTSGFSAIKYEGTGSAATLPHGLGVAPSMIIVKALETTDNWAVYHKSLGATKYIELNLSAAEGTSAVMWNNTEPTSTLFTVNTNGGVNTSGKDYIAYCFADVAGYSKMGSYKGNSNTEGPFVYTGFKPSWILIKNTTEGGSHYWEIYDNKRIGYQPNNYRLYPDNSSIEPTTTDRIDILSNGFKIRATASHLNSTNENYIYAAFGQTLVGTNNIPVTAR